MRNVKDITVNTVYGPTEVTLQAIDGIAGYKLTVKLAKILASAGNKITDMSNFEPALMSAFAEIPDDEFESIRKTVYSLALTKPLLQ